MLLFSPGVDDPQGPGLHAVHAPGRVPLPVTDGDGEPAVVRPHQVDHGALLALQLQQRPLTPVFGPPLWT